MDGVKFDRNRRKFPRVLSDFPIQLQPVPQTNPGHIYNSLSQDVSEGGLSISSFNFHPVNSRFAVEMFVAEDCEPVRSLGRVVWIRQLPYQDSYKVGIEFTDFNEEQRDVLIDVMSANLD